MNKKFRWCAALTIETPKVSDSYLLLMFHAADDVVKFK